MGVNRLEARGVLVCAHTIINCLGGSAGFEINSAISGGKLERMTNYKIREPQDLESRYICTSAHHYIELHEGNSLITHIFYLLSAVRIENGGELSTADCCGLGGGAWQASGRAFKAWRLCNPNHHRASLLGIGYRIAKPRV